MDQRIERIYWQVVATGGALPTREEGQSLVEYAMILAVGVLVVLAAVKGFGNSLAALFTRLIGQVTGIG